MNGYMQAGWTWVEGTHNQLIKLLDTLNDADLKFNPGGQNMTLGALFREMGEVEYSYTQSLKNLTQDFAYRNTTAGLDGSVAQLKAWFTQLNDDMKNTVSAMSDDDMKKEIDRGGGFKIPVTVQMDIYLQALLIFFGKASIFLRAMNRSLGELEAWIG